MTGWSPPSDRGGARGERVGMIRIKMFRPFPREEILELCAGAEKIGVLDRNYGADIGGIFCHELRAALQGQGDTLVQSYLVGVGGGDVVPDMVHEVVADSSKSIKYVRRAAGNPLRSGRSNPNRSSSAASYPPASVELHRASDSALRIPP